jgi:hypothetical protein
VSLDHALRKRALLQEGGHYFQNEQSVKSVDQARQPSTDPFALKARQHRAQAVASGAQQVLIVEAFPHDPHLPGVYCALQMLVVDGAHDWLASKVTDSSCISCKSSWLQALATTDSSRHPSLAAGSTQQPAG